MRWRVRAGKVETEANRKRSEAAKVQENRGNQYSKPSEKVEVPAQSVQVPPTKKQTGDEDRKAKVVSSKTNAGAVQRGDQLYKERPDLAKKVMAGAIKPAEALIKDDPEALEMWDNEMKGSHGGDHGNQYAKKVGKSDNVTLGKRGNSKAHSLSVLKHKAGVVPGGKAVRAQNEHAFKSHANRQYNRLNSAKPRSLLRQVT